MLDVARVILVVLLLAVTTFCVFGFLGTLEPGIRNVAAWQAAYIMVGGASLLIALWIMWIVWASWKKP